MARGMATKNTKSHENETGASLCYAQLDVRFVSWLPVPVAEVARLPGWSTGSLATSATNHCSGSRQTSGLVHRKSGDFRYEPLARNLRNGHLLAGGLGAGVEGLDDGIA